MLALSFFAACHSAPLIVPAGSGPVYVADDPDGINACLTANPPGENVSKLWHDLAAWAFAHAPEIPSSDGMTPAMAEALLDEAASKVEGLQTPAQWRSAGRYFQAENFHGLEAPACARATRLERQNQAPQ